MRDISVVVPVVPAVSAQPFALLDKQAYATPEETLMGSED